MLQGNADMAECSFHLTNSSSELHYIFIWCNKHLSIRWMKCDWTFMVRRKNTRLLNLLCICSCKVLAIAPVPLNKPWSICVHLNALHGVTRGHSMGLLPDTWNCGLRMRRECRERFPRHQLQRKLLAGQSFYIHVQMKLAHFHSGNALR